MPFPILAGPESEPFNTYSALSPAPGAPSPIGSGMISRRHPQLLGMQMIMPDGRKFRYAVAGGSTLVAADVLTSGVVTASQQNLTPAAAAVGDKSISLTTGASSALNLFAEGYAVIGTTPGGGLHYVISGHLLMTTGAGDLVGLANGHGIRVALTTTSRVDLIPNIYGAVIQSPATTVASSPVGVAVSTPLTLVGCWIQTKGPVPVLRSGTAIAGDVVGTGLGSAGAAGPIAALATQPIVGFCIFRTTSTFMVVNLTLDG